MNIRTLDNYLKMANENTMINGFSSSNPSLRKCSSNIQLQGDHHQNLLSYFLTNYKTTFAFYESNIYHKNL